MVSSENRQLWKRLTRLTRTNKSLGTQLTKISDTLKQHPSEEVPTALTYSFKEIPELFRESKHDKHMLSNNEGINLYLHTLVYSQVNAIAF